MIMRARYVLSLIAAFSLAGCDRITGAADQKILDAESVGYACRVSLKAPEDCIKENDIHSPTYLLNGWKAADRDISEKVLDPSMGASAAAAAASAAAAAAIAARNPLAVAHSAAEAAKPVSAAKVENKAAPVKSPAKPEVKPAEKPAKPAGEKPVTKPVQPGKVETEVKPAH